VVLGGGKPIWQKLFHKLGSYFNKRFDSDWKEKDQFFKEFEKQSEMGLKCQKQHSKKV